MNEFFVAYETEMLNGRNQQGSFIWKTETDNAKDLYEELIEYIKKEKTNNLNLTLTSLNKVY